MSVSLKVEERTFLRKIDWNLILFIFALNFIGLVNLHSASHSVHSTGLSHRFLMQLVWMGASWAIFFAMTFVDYKFWFRMAFPVYIFNVLALVVVQFFGHTSLGAQRWIDLKFMKYQPSETMKIALVLVLAKILSDATPRNGLGFRNLIIPGILTLIPFVLVVKQPDLGTALMLAAIAGTMVIFVRVQKKILIIALMLVVISGPLAWNFGLKTYQKNRILTFVHPGRDPRGTGYNSIQSKIAVGSGQILGKGYRKGTQSQLEFLPERTTDFIFSVLSEEYGFFGSTMTLILFALLFLCGIKIASDARDKFGVIMVIGLLSFTFWHMFINIGMVVGLMPIVGLPLPLLSYGGSSMITTMASLGIVSSVAYRKYLF